MGIKDLLGIVGALLGARERIILSFVGGFLVGLIIFGWLIWPVQWKDAAPVDLQQGYRQIYLEVVSRISQDDPGAELERLLARDSWSDEKLERDLTEAYNKVSDAAKRDRLVSLGSKLGLTVPATIEEQQGGGLSSILLIALLVLILSSVALVLIRLRQRGAAPVAVGGDPEKVAAARTVWSETEAPMAQFVTSYGIGDDYYDQSFSIETSTGEFLGECGVGISEAIGVGDPKKVTAFEVWLFDKNDIRTVTKVLMTEHCYGDDALRAKLAPKGEAVLGQEGTVISLETASLRVQTKVIEMEYGEGNLPPNSYVARLTIELAAWQLEGAVAGSGMEAAGDRGF